MDIVSGDINVTTPEGLAWKLLLEPNEIDDFGGILQTVQNDGYESQDMHYEQMIDQFHLLIQIALEIIFGYLKIEHMNKYVNEEGELDNDIDLDKNFNPDFSKYSLEMIEHLLKSRLLKIRYNVNLSEIIHDDKDNPRDFGEYSKYYCRIILKDTLVGQQHFWHNREKLDPNVRYTFVIRNNQDKKSKKVLNDFYAVCALPKFKFKISFTPFYPILKN